MVPLKSIVALLALALFCSTPLKAQNAIEQKNIVYKIAGKDSLMLDLFLPRQPAPAAGRPLVIIIHGGAWLEGDRGLDSIYFMKQFKEQLNNNGFAVASIDYRLVSATTHFPAPVADCKDAVRWMKAHAADFRIDTSNIGLWGGSAGGHLALLTTYTSDSLWTGDPKLADYSSKADYLIDFFGPTNLNTLLWTRSGKFVQFIARILLGKKLLLIREKVIQSITGYSADKEKNKVIAIATHYSPMEYVTNVPPTVIFHGTKDHVVPLKQSKKLHQLLDAKKMPNKLIIVKKGDHGFNNLPKDRVDGLVQETVNEILRLSKK